MNPSPIQIVSRHRFEDMFLKSSHHWVISIREADEIGIPRPDFIKPRVNLAFWDLINGPGIATPEDVESRKVNPKRLGTRWNRKTGLLKKAMDELSNDLPVCE